MAQVCMSGLRKGQRAGEPERREEKGLWCKMRGVLGALSGISKRGEAEITLRNLFSVDRAGFREAAGGAKPRVGVAPHGKGLAESFAFSCNATASPPHRAVI